MQILQVIIMLQNNLHFDFKFSISVFIKKERKKNQTMYFETEFNLNFLNFILFFYFVFYKDGIFVSNRQMLMFASYMKLVTFRSYWS